MGERRWEVGICGTFDVANYGDLLFPLIAESELTERLGAVGFHRFSYHARRPPGWPYEVTSLTELPRIIHCLDGLLIGGGHLIRFDKQVAPEYVGMTSGIHHPTGYWLTPALIALQHDVPVVWNAPAVHGDVPAWANPLMEAALTLSRYVAVRDEPSRSALEPLTSTPVAVVPDTAFRLPRLLNLDWTPSAEFRHLCEISGLRGPYIVVQASPCVERFVRFVKNHPQRFRNFRILALPISPVFGECQRTIDADLPGVVHLARWPSPLVVAELIGRSEAVIGDSYHLFITALASGVPVFTRQDPSKGKYTALRDFETIFVLPPNGEPDLDWFLARVGRTTPSASARATYGPLGDHWDRIAAALRSAPAPTAPVLNRFWQSLPTLLEDAATREHEAAAALANERLKAGTRLQEMRAETAARDARIAEIMASFSWRLTAPVRFAGRLLSKRRRQLINVKRIGRHRLETDPYRWAAIDGLFNTDDAAMLATTYPCDRFKLVAAHDGEKEYHYEARALIGMGAQVIAYPGELSDAWRALADDLLSQEYRAAISTLTGYDLTLAPMEVNVFHYGPGGSLGAHKDLPEKLVTHVLYFNRSWDSADGGCLRILRSADSEDLVAEIQPIVGNSSIIVRSENSWHAVSRVVNDSASPRRSVTVTFYRPGSVSTMWPPGDGTPLHRYEAADLA